MNFLWLSMTIVLSLVQIDALSLRNARQVASQCPNFNFCDYVHCENGQCIEDKTISDCFRCECFAGYEGLLCDTNITTPTTCALSCQNGGQCQSVSNSTYACACPADYTGAQCETSVTAPTITAPTITAPTITVTITAPTIIVTVTTTAPTITVTMTTTSSSGSTSGACTSTSCSNGGTCYSIGNDYICVCPLQYTGPTCSQQAAVTTPALTTASNTNACSPNPCNNGGTCYKYSGGAVCVCTSAYAGATCDTARTTSAPTTPSSSITCANQPCQNGAQCYNTASSYFCYCGAGSRYTGKNCETTITAAEPACPLNCSPGGYCIRAGNNPSAFACMCGNTLKPTSCASA